MGAAGGIIQAKGGATVYPSVGLDWKLSSKILLSTHAGYVRVLDGDFEAYALGAGIKYISKTNGTLSKTNKIATKVKTKGLRLSVQHQTYFEVARSVREPFDVHLLALQLNYDISKYFYVTGQASFVYESIYNGTDPKSKLGPEGYADRMFGLGFYSPIFAKEKTQLFTEALIGAGGGAEIDTGEGIINKLKIGSYYRINDYLSVLASVGVVISPTTNVNSNNINFGLSVDFSTLTSIF